MKNEHVKDAAQDVAEGVVQGVPQDVAQELAFGARAARASSPRHHRRRRLCAAYAEIGAQLGSSEAFGSGCGQAFRGCHAKRLYVYVHYRSREEIKIKPGSKRGSSSR